MTIKFKKQIQNQAQAGYMQNNEPQITGGEAGKKNRIKTHSQSGRSMVEMLGVLAIIGVLSIGGIAGYRLAMNYYQANQIAYEINMMRTDAKVKIAQGTEKLTLGSPYDSGNIHFNNYGTTFACALADDSVIEENVSCQVANAFYIEMKNVSQEICRPLSKLIQGMNELIGFEITTEIIEADNEECQEGDNNIHAVFSAEAVSELKACKEEGDCSELESTPICDLSRHVCVECTSNDDCLKKGTDKPICNKENKCEECPKKSFWNGEKCQEGCRKNEHCAEDEYCYKVGGFSCTDEWGTGKDGGSCRKVANDLISGTVNGETYYGSTVKMNWWSVGRFCDALDKTPVTRADLGCGNKSSESDGYCTNAIMSGLKGFVYIEPSWPWYWLESYSNQCYAYDINLVNGSLSHPLYNNKNTLSEYALCKSKG